LVLAGVVNQSGDRAIGWGLLAATLGEDVGVIVGADGAG
jgi:hypothetical protein